MSSIELNTFEKIVALLILEERSTAEIADFQGVTRGHINNTKQRLCELMQCDNAHDAAEKARGQGLLEGI